MDEILLNKQRKIFITEEDICTLLQRYSATQLLALLREVSQSRELKIDWSVIASKKSIGIKSARECQMLWRHLAYGHLIFDKIEPEANPLDDDSDLESEVEASPPVSTDVLTEAANCVKALAAGSQAESLMPNNSTVEVDLANGQSSHVSSEHSHPSLLHSSNMSLPMCVQKPTQFAGISGEGLDGNGAANSNYPSKKKRYRWTEEDDLVLINAVKKHGEGIWATIVKSEFNGNRTAPQLSQRWSNLKKKQGSVNMAVNTPQFSEQHLATRHALEHALKNPVAAGGGTGAGGTSQSTNVKVSNKDPSVTNDVTQSQQQIAQVSNTCAKPIPMASTSTHPLPRKPPSVTTDSLQATAVAVGARVSRLSDSQSLVRVAQAKNSVHIRAATGSTASLPPNVHFICTGLSSTPPTVAAARATSYAVAAGGHPAKGSVVKPSVPIVSGTKLERSNEISGEVKVPSLNTKLPMEVSVPPEKGQSTSPSAVAELGKQTDCTDSRDARSKNLTKTEHGGEVCTKATEVLISKDGNEKSVIHKSANSSTNETREVVDGVVENKKPSKEALEGTGK